MGMLRCPQPINNQLLIQLLFLHGWLQDATVDDSKYSNQATDERGKERRGSGVRLRRVYYKPISIVTNKIYYYEKS